MFFLLSHPYSLALFTPSVFLAFFYGWHSASCCFRFDLFYLCFQRFVCQSHTPLSQFVLPSKTIHTCKRIYYKWNNLVLLHQSGPCLSKPVSSHYIWKTHLHLPRSFSFGNNPVWLHLRCHVAWLLLPLAYGIRGMSYWKVLYVWEWKGQMMFTVRKLLVMLEMELQWQPYRGIINWDITSWKTSSI